MLRRSEIDGLSPTSIVFAFSALPLLPHCILTRIPLDTFQVENPFARPVYQAEDVSSTVKFSFVADTDGEYKLCFSDNPRPGMFGAFSISQVEGIFTS